MFSRMSILSSSSPLSYTNRPVIRPRQLPPLASIVDMPVGVRRMKTAPMPKVAESDPVGLAMEIVHPETAD